ncbi:MAG: hypothetical protein L0G99_02815, partial [Propionibacteriales bacterium]|nr:hypothetical protein [Propionibacteriales bacterium]
MLTSVKSRPVSWVAALALIVTLLLAGIPSARAEGTADDVTVPGALGADGRLAITETYTFAGAA